MKNFENIRKKHIDNGSELFGDKSISNNAYAYTNPNAKNGFESLKAYDTNNDNIIDNGEPIKLSDKVKSINLNLLIAWIFEFVKVSLNL